MPSGRVRYSQNNRYYLGEMPQLALQTAIGFDVPNDQDAIHDQAGLDAFVEEFARKWRVDGCELREPVILRYNCHGFTFAARRTWIDDPQQVVTILQHDGYSEIPQNEVAAGDVAVYYGITGRPEHSGLVIEHKPAAHALMRMPRVLSKWAKVFEVVHWANQCP